MAEEQTLNGVLSDVIQYFMFCKANAAKGSAAERKFTVYVEAVSDAKELLKKQEPRLMTLEEVVKHYSLPPVVLDDLNWQEDYLQDIEPLYFDFPVNDSWAVHWRGYQYVRKYIDDWKASYGQKWRCWTARPTDEQRKATPWEPPKEEEE